MEYMDLLPPTAPSLVLARETCTPYYYYSLFVGQLICVQTGFVISFELSTL